VDEGKTTPEGWWVPPSDDETSRNDETSTDDAVVGAAEASLDIPGLPVDQIQPKPPTDAPTPAEAATPVLPAVPVASPVPGLMPDLRWVSSAHAAPGTASQWPGLATWQSAQTPQNPQTPQTPQTAQWPSQNIAATTPAQIPAPQTAGLASSPASNPFGSRGTTVLVLSILGAVLSVTCIGGLFAPVAWIMGNGVRNDARSTGWPEPRKNKAGRIVAMCGTILGVLAVLVLAAYAVSNASSTT
jgi:hypothetical protein